MGQLAREVRRTVTETAFVDNPRQTIFGMALVSLFVGLFLLRDFPVFANVPAYRFFRHLSENTWAVIFIAVGGSSYLAQLFNDALMRCSRLRYLPFVLSLATLALWLTAWAGIVASNPNTMGTVIYFIFVLAPLWTALRTWGLARGTG